MNKLIAFVLIISASLTLPVYSQAQDLSKTPKNPTIMNFLVESYPQFTTLVKAVNTARLELTFENPGPVTVFAPSNKAFEIMPAGTVDNWLKPEMSDSLKKVLTYHVITGSWNQADLLQKIKEGGGTLSIPTIGEGGKLTFTLEAGRVAVKDNHGFTTVLGTPVQRYNGLVYVIDKLLLP